MFRSLVPYLQLCRFAAVFTAVSDICAGLALTGQLTPWSWANLWLICASAGLYLSGMVFNDYFDRRIDAVERPKRPIPSGRVSALSAARVGVTLLIAGLVFACVAAFQSGRTEQPVVVAVLLAGAILAYDGGGKGTAFGPVIMGSCRFLNLLLGASLALPVVNAAGVAPTNFGAVWQNPQLFVAGALWVYISGVTLFAKNEAGASRRGELASAIGVINAGLLLLGLYCWFHSDPWNRGGRAVLALGMIALVINRAAVSAWRDPRPMRVQFGVRTMLSWLILLDAVLVFHTHPNAWVAIAVALLILPAKWIGKSLAIT
ncbi:MAG: UbiA family prenyltransferase [Planctomycetota bacterium]|nr:UbiA family prenyltransferase [Planctomycetota bacterium]